VKVIDLLTALPEITGPVVIDATTQPGYASAPLIELNGANVPFESGLVITGGNTTVRGLAIGGFPAAGIVLRACDNNVIQGNRIGTDAAGSLPRPNNIGILLTESSNNVIGGTSTAARNVISGNVTHGVEIGGSNNVVAGNFIGTNAAGNAAIGNGSAGVKIPFSTRTNNLIGGATEGAGNLISGNATGIDIESPGNTIQGNLIGTDVTGFSRIHNLTGIDAKSPDTLIGGLTREARNIISGNSTGVLLRGNGSRLQGNYIGTDMFGSFPLGNSNNGVVAGDNVLIGGTTAEARNVISANGGFGNVVLGLSSFGPGATVQGNYIGTDASGGQALSESTVAGIAIFSSGNLIGGTVPGAQNVISGNQVGIQLGSFSSGPPQENTIQGNLIGLSASFNSPLPNTAGGIEFFDTFNNTVGGTQNGAANKIAFNGGPGVGLFRGTRNSVRGNSIFSNAGLGIDLVGDGVTANDPADSDAGANNLQNFPVLTSVTSSGNSTTVQGSLKSTPNTTFDIDFYSSAALDSSGNGEGARFFNTMAITTDGNGESSFNVTFSMPPGTGRVLTATATDQDGNTSEFSAGDATSAAGNLQFSVNSMNVIEDVGFATVTVVRKGGSVGTLTVEYTSTAGTATAGQDYVPPFGFLTFNSGETSKSFQIPIADDVATEPDETFEVQLNAGNPEILGAPISLLVTIQDRNTDPVIAQGSATVVEGNTGTRDALFTFSLSAATGRTVSVNYTTQNVTASGGASCSSPGTDYETASGTIVFQPRVTSVTIPVKICGDVNAESTERFRIVLSNTSNAALGFPQALGTITDDDLLELLREDSGPTVNQAAALDALLMLRDPFRVMGIPEWSTTSPDRNTRVMFFVRGLQLDPGELPSAVIVRLTGSNGQFIDVAADDVRAIPDVDFAQVVIRVPDNLIADVYAVTVRAHSRISNTGTIRIAP
jgi:Calx-beta domain-containing protein